MNKNNPMEAPKKTPRNTNKKNIPPKMRRMDLSVQGAAINLTSASLASMSGTNFSPLYIPGEEGPGSGYDEKIAQKQQEEEKKRQAEMQQEEEKEQCNDFELEAFDILQLGTEGAWKRCAELFTEKKADPQKVEKKIKKELPKEKQALSRFGLEKACLYMQENKNKTVIREQEQARKI